MFGIGHHHHCSPCGYNSYNPFSFGGGYGGSMYNSCYGYSGGFYSPFAYNPMGSMVGGYAGSAVGSAVGGLLGFGVGMAAGPWGGLIGAGVLAMQQSLKARGIAP